MRSQVLVLHLERASHPPEPPEPTPADAKAVATTAGVTTAPCEMGGRTWCALAEGDDARWSPCTAVPTLVKEPESIDSSPGPPLLAVTEPLLATSTCLVTDGGERRPPSSSSVCARDRGSRGGRQRGGRSRREEPRGPRQSRAMAAAPTRRYRATCSPLSPKSLEPSLQSSQHQVRPLQTTPQARNSSTSRDVNERGLPEVQCVACSCVVLPCLSATFD